MANVLPGGDGMMGQFPLEQWFYEMPVCTRWWMTAALSASVLVQCHILSPFQLFYSFRTVFVRSQYWRLITTFFYFGPFSLDLLYHIFFLQRYSRLLEESSRTVASPLFVAPHIRFNAAPMHGSDAVYGVLGLGFVKYPSLHLESQEPRYHAELLGGVCLQGTVPSLVGHIWYFFNDVYPPLHHGHSPLDPPTWWVRLFEGPPPAPETTETDGLADQPVEDTAAQT
ncbi:hypothetical protein N0V90_001526 [Kalmusia sp. IMI 367209]|nr:hypothetical protein N0V90_001526 [Kalmusia sp. IMI 367209]